MGGTRVTSGVVWYASRFWWHLRVHGPLHAFRLGISNLGYSTRRYLDERFDRKYGVETTGRIELQDLAISSRNTIHGVYYEPTPRRAFHKIIRSIPVDFSEYEFVDFGSGKGRVLLLAANYPFKKVTGVEFSPDLAEIAQLNVSRFSRSRPVCRRIEVVCMDAAEYEIPEQKAILYFFNPFGAAIMRQIAANLQAVWRRSGEEKFVVYYHPQSAAVFDSFPFLERVATCRRVLDIASPQWRGYVVYRTCQAPWRDAPDRPEPRTVPH